MCTGFFQGGQKCPSDRCPSDRCPSDRCLSNRCQSNRCLDKCPSNRCLSEGWARSRRRRLWNEYFKTATSHSILSQCVTGDHSGFSPVGPKVLILMIIETHSIWPSIKRLIAIISWLCKVSKLDKGLVSSNWLLLLRLPTSCLLLPTATHTTHTSRRLYAVASEIWNCNVYHLLLL